MGEIRTEAKRYIYEYICDECGVGQMILSFPPQWNHRCDSCGHEQVLDGEYPHVGFGKADDGKQEEG